MSELKHSFGVILLILVVGAITLYCMFFVAGEMQEAIGMSGARGIVESLGMVLVCGLLPIAVLSLIGVALWSGVQSDNHPTEPAHRVTGDPGRARARLH